MRKVTIAAALAVGVVGFAAVSPAGGATAGVGLYPDMQTVVPKHLSVQNQQQREILRFSNGIANTGAGDWRMRPENTIANGQTVTNAVQEILDASGNIVHEQVVSTFEFHEAHNHWHIGDVALFEVRPARDDGRGGRWGVPLINDRGESQSIKTTFCLIDWYKLDDNSPTAERTYFDCYTSYQGISPGWVDQYHQSTSGQQVDVTGAKVGVYYLVSTANPEGTFLETDTTNNTAWTSFKLTRDSKGNPKISIVANSPCSSPGMCGAQSTNR
ncbi:MAG TPA: lysyl oxidase family protein [Actinomycetota bacterium]|nr:lysyl oxidase family protein [Actinomycetota bacterium]